MRSSQLRMVSSIAFICSASLNSPGDIKNHPSFETSKLPKDHGWSGDNLPPLLFYLFGPVPEEGAPSKRRVTNILEDGQEVDVPGTVRKLRDFDYILPRKIGLNVEGRLPTCM